MLLTALVLTGSALYVTARSLIQPWLRPAEPHDDAQPEPGDEQALVPVRQDPIDEDVDHFLAASSAGTGLAVAGMFLTAPPLLLLSGAVTLYTCLPIFHRAYRAVFIEKRIQASILDSIAVLAILISGFYFFGALTNTFYYIGRKLLSKTEAKTRERLTDLFGERPRTIWIERDGAELEIPFEELQHEDIVVVTAGQVLPVDGIVKMGLASVDQHLLTGESRPVDKGEGDRVYATTVVLSGRIYVTVERTGADTVVAQIGEALRRTADYRTTVEARSEKLADQAVLPMLGLSAVALARVGTHGAVAVLSSNYAENVRITMPLGMLNFLNRAARSHILIKDGRALELLNQIDTIIFDKTGTLTLDEPSVGDIHTCNDEVDGDTLLRYAAAAEIKQSHPLAAAIRKAAAERGLFTPERGPTTYQAGYGLLAEVEAQAVRVGSGRYMEMEGIEIPEHIRDCQAAAHARGSSSVYVSIGDKLAGMVELRPTLRKEAQQVIDALKARGLSITIVSGDHAAPTEHLADSVNIGSYYAEVLPEGKAELVQTLQQRGRKVCFVGDGLNDSIALKQANVSISMRGATTLATDTAQIVLLDSSLSKLPALFELADEFHKNQRNSLYTVLIPGVAVMGGVFLFHLGIYASMIAFNLSLLAGVGNSMLPALKREPSEQDAAGPDAA